MSPMPKAQANGIELEYETFGDPSDPALLLIMGFGAQMTYWPDQFCRMLAERGFHVVRFDNRDVGLSTKVESASMPPYTLDDMADDAAGLLDALGLERAHVVGASMGGFIAQLVAVRHPDKVATLCSIMSSTGNPGVGQPTEEALAALLTPPPPNREDYVERGLAVARVIGSPGYPASDDYVRQRAGAAFDRSFYPEGTLRQFQAIMAQSDRTEVLGAVAVPTLVVHGAADPLVTPSGGEATARAVPGAELLMVEGMGHDLPEPLWPQLVDAIAANARKAGGPEGAVRAEGGEAEAEVGEGKAASGVAP